MFFWPKSFGQKRQANPLHRDEGVMIVRGKILRIGKNNGISRVLITAINGDIPDCDNELKMFVDVVVEDVLSNLKKFDRVVHVHWKRTHKGFVITFQAESHRINYEMLATCLEETRIKFKNGERCHFLEEGSGLGHYFIASIPERSHYDQEGILHLEFRTEHLPDASTLQLVDTSDL